MILYDGSAVKSDLSDGKVIMFENLISNLKIHGVKVSESIKKNTNSGLDNFKCKFKEWSPVGNVEHNPIAQSPSTPNSKDFVNDINIEEPKWGIEVNNDYHSDFRLPGDDFDKDDVLERFNHVHRSLRRRNEREEIRRRLAMGTDVDDYYGGERSGRKPSLQSRLQSGMNLQICFMNETMSDNESPNAETEVINTANTAKTKEDSSDAQKPAAIPVKSVAGLPSNHIRPSTSLLSLPLKKELRPIMTEADFFACQAQLQAEAREALSQAKDMAHMQMEVEKQQQLISPITEMVRCSLEKVGVKFPEDRRRLSRQMLTEMNVAQLQVIVNELHTQIEVLNERLVKFLMGRDDLHMEQDSMLVDIEDLTRYLGAKEKPVAETLLNHNTPVKRSQKVGNH